jgi:predicted 3-demethylubiquinone-9 3-methyltransferase (glyoxalase superfamily)
MENLSHQKIAPFLWFENNAEEAMNFYVSVFKNSKILNIHRMPADGHLPKGAAMSGTFLLEGQVFHALNGRPEFSFTPAISLFVNCDTQEEVDTLWEALSSHGEEQRCGWVKDKFGVSWQVIPRVLGELIGSNDRMRAGRAMQAMLKMNKIDIATIRQAYNRP